MILGSILTGSLLIIGTSVLLVPSPRVLGWIVRTGVLVPILYAAFKLAGVVP